MNMLNYRSMTGGEITYWHGELYFWVPWGVYILTASDLSLHKTYHGTRVVSITLKDITTNYSRIIVQDFDDGYDDYEIIYRFLSGTASCDCVRGKMLYGDTLDYTCNKDQNRYILQELAISGAGTNCVLKFKRYA